MALAKRVASRWYRTILWALKYPTDSFGKKLSILCDYISLYRRKGLEVSEYYEYEFEKRSKEFRNSFLGLNEQRYYLDLLNPKKFYILARNKFVAHKMLENTGCRKSEIYCYYQPEGVVFNSDEIASCINDVIRILKNKNVSQCVIKDTENSHGEGVIVVKGIEFLENDCILKYFNGKEKKLSEVLGEYPLLFEGLVRQTNQFNSFNESSVNTVRFMTALYPNGEAKIIATFIKIGRAGRCVDNAGGGGNVDVCVDVESGEIKYAIQYDGWRKIKEIERHPDTGNQLNGVIIENWDYIKQEVIKYQQAYPYMKVAGWDIAITDDGPVVIEVNDFWDRTGQYFIRRGWRNEIRECYLEWKKLDKDNKMYRQMNVLTESHLKKISRYE